MEPFARERPEAGTARKEKEEVLSQFAQLLLKMAIVMVFYFLLSNLPPLGKVTIPGAFWTPLDLLKMAAYGFVAGTLFASRTRLSEDLGSLTPESALVSRISSWTFTFFALLFLYLGFKDIPYGSDGRTLIHSAWFLWTFLIVLAVPIVAAGALLYKHTEALVQILTATRERFHPRREPPVMSISR